MVLIDHVIGYMIEGEEPLEPTPDVATLGFMRLEYILLIFFIATVVISKKKIATVAILLACFFCTLLLLIC
ncbi:hypothetical protein KEJ43_06830 [Candidatus Bathyarchaeota archaeon]|nr:hypothetical protein [Candidatus Bathyarchaeota archaeon]